MSYHSLAAFIDRALHSTWTDDEPDPMEATNHPGPDQSHPNLAELPPYRWL